MRSVVRTCLVAGVLLVCSNSTQAQTLVKWNGHYYGTTPTGSWTQAENYARGLGGHLVTIDSAAENTFLYNTFVVPSNKQNHWVGLTCPAPADYLKKSNWLWVSGASSTYRNWRAGQPDRGYGSDRYGAIAYVGTATWDNYPDTGFRTPRGIFELSKLRLTTDTDTVSLSVGGTQKLTLDAGAQHGTRFYWLFGSVTGTQPGVTLVSAIGLVNVPLNPDIWTDYTIALANTATLTRTKAPLDGFGKAQAFINIPKVNLPSAIGLVFHHAYLVYDAQNNFYIASNSMPLRLVK